MCVCGWWQIFSNFLVQKYYIKMLHELYKYEETYKLYLYFQKIRENFLNVTHLCVWFMKNFSNAFKVQKY